LKTGASPRRTVAAIPSDALGAGSAEPLGAGVGAALATGELAGGAALGSTAVGGGGSGSAEAVAEAEAEATSGAGTDAAGAGAADAEGADAETEASGLTRGDALGAGAADAEGAPGAVWAWASGTPSSALESSAHRAMKASRSPQTRAHTHEYDEDLTLGPASFGHAERDCKAFHPASVLLLSYFWRTGRWAAEAIAKILGRG